MKQDGEDVDAIEEHMDDTKFGVLILGAPGTGKTTFSKTLHDFFDDNV